MNHNGVHATHKGGLYTCSATDMLQSKDTKLKGGAEEVVVLTCRCKRTTRLDLPSKQNICKRNTSLGTNGALVVREGCVLRYSSRAQYVNPR